MAGSSADFFLQAARLLTVLDAQCDMDAMVEALGQSVESGNKILFFGNGGSAADAQHLTAECLVRLRPERLRPPIAALCLSLDSSTLTACANDLGFDQLFERAIAGLGCPGDVAFALSTSGSSENVVRGLRCARDRGLTTVGFLGGTGGAALAACDYALVVPAHTTALIQIAHIAAGHQLLFQLEDRLFPQDPLEVGRLG